MSIPMKRTSKLRAALILCLSTSALAQSATPTSTPSAATPAGSRPTNMARPASGAPTKSAGDTPPAKGKQVDEIAAARASLVKRLIDLADWCHSRTLIEERDKIYKQVLVLDPDNSEAHIGLGYLRTPERTWRDPPKPSEGKNRNPSALLEFPKKRSEAVKPFSKVLIAKAREPGTDAVTRKLYIDQVLAVDPDDALAHELVGDVHEGENWVLPETVRGKARRGEIKGFASAALAGVPASAAETPAENDIVIDRAWSSALRVGPVRLFGTVGADEAATIARDCAAAGTFASSVFGAECPFPQRYTLYALDKKDKDTFLKRLPDIDDAERDRLAKLEGSGIPRREDVALWTGDPARTLDAAVRHTLSHLFGRAFGMTQNTGWAWEGFGLYLTRELIGTRLTWFVSESPADAAGAAASLRGTLLSPKTNWMNEALTLLASEDPPSIEAVMKRDLGHLDTRDVLTSYALAAYLVEGRPDVAATFVKRSSAGEDPARVIQEVLGCTPFEFTARLTRWLTERR